MTSCSLMGLAYLAAACTHNEPCGINEDGGLLTGVVVAHELGHVYVNKNFKTVFFYIKSKFNLKRYHF